ncbi:MAG: hypothetical protein U1E36_07670 [Rickettsiales bacterium]
MDKNIVIQEIPERLQQPMADVINNAIVETFLTVFDVPVIGVEKILHYNLSKEDLACRVKLIENEAEVDVVFIFAKQLVENILGGVYPEEQLKHDLHTYNDAACEIANIVCAHLKAFLNQKGYDLKMNLPLPVSDLSFETISRHSINLYFTLNRDDKDMLVNVRMYRTDEDDTATHVA